MTQQKKNASIFFVNRTRRTKELLGSLWRWREGFIVRDPCESQSTVVFSDCR